jgi:hypothetical protein
MSSANVLSVEAFAEADEFGLGEGLGVEVSLLVRVDSWGWSLSGCAGVP